VDRVFAGNAYLADYARQFNDDVHIVPTTLDTDTHAPRARPPHAGVCVGWSGSPSTAPYFDRLVSPLSTVKQRFGDGVYFRFIGDETYRRPELGIVGRPWREETEVEDAAELDIGLMPLPDDPWSRGKCGFKALLYMALAIPPVISPVGVNATIVQDGETGYLAADDETWVSALSRLIQDQDLRRDIGRRGRVFVVARFSLQAQRDRYVKLFDELCAA
jgi:glycosyltransferase involved in cell wall biosynthesis